MEQQITLTGRLGGFRIGGFRGRASAFFGLVLADGSSQPCACRTAVPRFVAALQDPAARLRFVEVSGVMREGRDGPFLLIGERGRVRLLGPLPSPPTHTDNGA